MKHLPQYFLTLAILLGLPLRASCTIHYVDLNSTNTTPPYTSWTIAATNIQEAVDAAVAGDEIVVTNGLYAAGQRTNSDTRVVVDKPVSLRSMNGPIYTGVSGRVRGGSLTCVYLTNGASLSGFTLTGGSGGVSCEGFGAVISNCVITGNRIDGAYFRENVGGGGAFGGTLYNCTLTDNSVTTTGSGLFAGGGGAYFCLLNNCTLSGNSASVTDTTNSISVPCVAAGGGAYLCTLNNCTLTGNSVSGNAGYGGGGGGATQSTLNNCTLSQNEAVHGGGAQGCTLNNCIIYFNNYENCDSSTLNYSCTTLQPATGFGCITNAPSFVVPNGWDDLRLQSNSPCINAGNNSYVASPTDLDGNLRVQGGTVDMGAYEFQSPASVISYAWLQQFGLPTDGSADFADTDRDGLNNWQEWVCGTDPTNTLSALRLFVPVPTGTNVLLSWQSIAGKNYFLERSASLGPPVFQPLATNIAGQLNTTTFSDTNAIGAGPWFYRVGVSGR
jgi:hypothetical protein